MNHGAAVPGVWAAWPNGIQSTTECGVSANGPMKSHTDGLVPVALPGSTGKTPDTALDQIASTRSFDPDSGDRAMPLVAESVLGRSPRPVCLARLFAQAQRTELNRRTVPEKLPSVQQLQPQPQHQLRKRLVAPPVAQGPQWTTSGHLPLAPQRRSLHQHLRTRTRTRPENQLPRLEPQLHQTGHPDAVEARMLSLAPGELGAAKARVKQSRTGAGLT